MKLARYIARIGERKNAYKIMVGNPEGKSHSEDLGVDGMTTLE
jgi:hypothetical protein